MPVAVSMHACSAWPVNIDFTVFGFFLKGYSVEETVEQLMALQSVAPGKSQVKRRTSSASSSSSSEASLLSSSAHSPVHSAESFSPTTFVPQDATSRGRRTRGSDSTPRLSKVCNDAGDAASNLKVLESELLTEDRRVATEEEQPEELTLSPTLPRPATGTSASAACNASGPTWSPAVAPGITAVDTSTNATRQRHNSTSPLHGRYDTPSIKATQQPQALPHRPPQQSSANHLHQSHTHRHRHGGTNESSSHRKKTKSRHAAGTRSSSAQHTATASSTASFALPPMWSYDGNATVHNSSSPQHTRHSSAMMSIDEFTSNADGTAARGHNGSAGNGNHHHHHHHNNATAATAGEGKNSSADNRRAARQRKRKERQCFFLNEDYIKFQRQLQEGEAMGGLGVGASSLQSRFLFEEVTEQFQAFRELAREEQLGSPYAFLSNYYMPIPIAMRLELLRMYYATDPGIFRWAFGDKLNRFDLPGALAAVREECLSGTFNISLFGPSNGNLSMAGGGGGGNGGLNATGGNSAGANSVGSFWTGRWKSSPGKLATMDGATLLRLNEQHIDALRRQWENVKHVCVTVAALYRGKGGMCVPLDMALLTTIQQCFGLRNEQALDYATAAFGYEHRLDTRLFDRLHTFSEYGAICSIIASLWCDESGYFLSESFRAGCRKMGRLLDEYRLLSELHPFIFGEPMRPRWQVQLDEVQRVITTSSLVDKNTVAAGSPVASGTAASASPVTAMSSTSIAGLAGVRGSGGVAGATFNGSPGGLSGAGMNASGSLGGGGGSGVGGWEGLNPSSTTGNATAATNNNANAHSPLSGNGQYSRRFLMEFPSIMKHLLRICVALGNSGGVNDALDIFFIRVYSYLELLSSRTAPAIVSMVMNATGPGGLTAVAGLPPAHGSFASGLAIQNTSSGAFGKPPLPPYAERVRSHPDLGRVSGLDIGSPAVHAFSGPVTPLRNSNSSGGAGLTMPKTASAASLSGVVAGDGAAEDVLVAGSSLSYAASTVVNTSLFHPASALLPLSAAIAAHNAGSFASSPLSTVLIGRSLSAEEQLPDLAATTGGAPHGNATTISTTPSSAGFSGGNGGSANALSTSRVGEMVRKAIDKRYLRELCTLLAALPKAWRQLASLTAEEQAATDKTMSDLAMALKAVTQVLMASDDFH